MTKRGKVTYRDTRGKYTRSVRGARLAAGLILALFFLVVAGYGKRQDLLAQGYLQEGVNFYANPKPDNYEFKVSTAVPRKSKEAEVQRFEWDDVARIIIEEWSDLGKVYTYQALQVAWCESHFNEKAINTSNKNGSHDEGVFQINSVHRQPVQITMNARQNIKWAKQKFIKDGFSWEAWVCKPK
jgi:hypothetical protein